MAGRPGTAGSTWKVDSCSVTARTAQMFSFVGRIESASNAAKMSMAHASRLLTFAGRCFAISARATSGSMGGSRNDGLVHADTRAVPASTTARTTLRLLDTRELFVRWDAAIRREFIDGLRQFATQSMQQLVPRHSGLLDQPLDALFAERLFDLVRRDLLVGAGGDPALHFVVMTALSESIQQIFQTCPERAAGQSSSEPTASWRIAYTAAGLIRTEHVGEPAFALQRAIGEQAHESDHDRGHAAARITAQCVEHTSPPVRGHRFWH